MGELVLKLLQVLAVVWLLQLLLLLEHTLGLDMLLLFQGLFMMGQELLVMILQGDLLDLGMIYREVLVDLKTEELLQLGMNHRGDLRMMDREDLVMKFIGG